LAQLLRADSGTPRLFLFTQSAGGERIRFPYKGSFNEQYPSSNGLEQGLKPRHVTMLSIAGVIGAGLFVGSGHAIAAAGPAVLLAYAAAGTLVVLVMRMLGEMAVASPDTGSFSTYADRAIGHWAGFTIGWLYWWFWVLVIPLEANAAATILHAWFPSVAIWAFALVITMLLTVTNLFSVKNYGEFEFWFALIKVLAIIGFIVLGVLAIFGFLPTARSAAFRTCSTPKASCPTAWARCWRDPDHHVLVHGYRDRDHRGRRIEEPGQADHQGHQLGDLADRLVLPRVDLHRRGPGAVERSALASLGSYQTVLERMGIPNAKLIVDIVVLVAVTSCLNSALYTSSRMLFSLASAVMHRPCPPHQQQRHALLGGDAVHRRCVPGDIRQLRGPGGSVRIPAGQLRRHRAAGVPGDRVSQLRMRKQRMAAARKSSSACGCSRA
jgi:GABA permease